MRFTLGCDPCGDLCEMRWVSPLATIPAGSDYLGRAFRWCRSQTRSTTGYFAGKPPACGSERRLFAGSPAGRWKSERQKLPPPHPGRFFFACGYRWLSPPANILRPSGPQPSSTGLGIPYNTPGEGLIAVLRRHYFPDSPCVPVLATQVLRLRYASLRMTEPFLRRHFCLNSLPRHSAQCAPFLAMPQALRRKD